MYARATNITNVGGRINYCTNKKDKEEVVGVCNTASEDFWKLLAKENQWRFRQSTNARRPDAKASEAREFVIGLPAHLADAFAAKYLATTVKMKLGVECFVAIHKKYNADGKLNVHAHVIVAERTLLPEPIVTEERRAERTYYYDAAGKKCKKADAVKVTRKGDVTQEASIQYFSNKSDFFSLKKVEPLLDTLAQTFSMERFDENRHFPTRHIGKNNPKEEYIKAYNTLVSELNAFFDKEEAEGSEPAKKRFCAATGVPARFGINRTEEVRGLFEAYKKQLEEQAREIAEQKSATLMSRIEDLQSAEQLLEEDIRKAEEVLAAEASADFVKLKVAEIHRKDLEERYREPVSASFLAKLKATLAKIKEALRNCFRQLGILQPVKSVGEDLREQGLSRQTKDNVEPLS